MESIDVTLPISLYLVAFVITMNIINIINFLFFLVPNERRNFYLRLVCNSCKDLIVLGWHNAFEKGTIDGLINATDAMAKLL